MSGKHLLDTNIIIALFKNEERVRIQLINSEEVFVPAIAIGELHYGARHSANVQKNTNQVQDFANAASVLPCDVETAEHYGQIKNDLKAKGRPVPENDLWIAAIARQYSLIVVSRDQHFKAIDELAVEEW